MRNRYAIDQDSVSCCGNPCHLVEIGASVFPSEHGADGPHEHVFALADIADDLRPFAVIRAAASHAVGSEAASRVEGMPFIMRRTVIVHESGQHGVVAIGRIAFAKPKREPAVAAVLDLPPE